MRWSPRQLVVWCQGDRLRERFDSLLLLIGSHACTDSPIQVERHTDAYTSAGGPTHGGGETRRGAHAVSAEPRDSPCYLLALGNAGLVCRRLGRHDEATRWLRAWRAVYQPAEDQHPPSSVQFVRNYGEALSFQEQRTRALDVFAEACALADKFAVDYPDMRDDFELEKAHTLISTGATLLRLSAEDAITPLRSAREIFKRIPRPGRVGHAEVLSNLGIAYHQLGRDTEADLAFEPFQ